MDEAPIAATPLRRQRGFTLIEMMIVVAVIAILALIVVPTFFKESRKTKSASEVSPMMAEFAVKEEQYRVANGVYLDTTACPSAAPGPQGTAASTCVAAADWTSLRINPPETNLYCSYDVTIGTGTGTNDPDGFTWDSPDADWWYVVATCDMDGDSSKNATYFKSSSDNQIQKLNEGY